MKNAALYIRVSTEEQKRNGLSVDSQLEALKAYCGQNKYNIVKIYNDAGISARKPYNRRPALLELLEDCKQKKIDIILFTKLDRWFRSVSGYYEVQNVLDACGVPWRAIWEDYETETANGVLKVNIMLSVAQSEADRTSERIKAVNAYRRTLGCYTQGKAPIGYKSVKSHIIKDETAAPAVKAFFAEYLDTGSMTKAYKKLLEHGYNIARTNAQKMLLNPTYYGDAHGVPCEPYITIEEHERIKEIKEKNHTRAAKFGRVYIFSGLIRCACCGNNYAGDYRKIKNGECKVYRCNSHREFRCTNAATVQEKNIEEFLLENIAPALDDYKLEIKARNKNKEEKKKKADGIRGKLKRLKELYIEGDIEKEDYKSKSEALTRELNEIEVEAVEKLPYIPNNFIDIYNQLNETNRRSFWLNVLKYITIDDQKNIKIYF